MRWLQDGNWPVAQALAPLLARMGTALVPEVEKVLTGTDELWKYWTMELLVARMEPVDIEAVRPLLEKLSRKESDDDVHIVARRILQTIDG